MHFLFSLLQITDVVRIHSKVRGWWDEMTELWGMQSYGLGALSYGVVSATGKHSDLNLTKVTLKECM